MTFLKKLTFQLILLAVILNITSLSFAVFRPPEEEPQGEEWLSKYKVEIPPNEKRDVYRDITIPLRLFEEKEIIKDLDAYLSQHAEELTGLSADELKLHYSVQIQANSAHSGIVYVQYIQSKDDLGVADSSLRFLFKHDRGIPYLVHARSTLFPGIVFPQTPLLGLDVLQEEAKKILGITQKQH